MKKRIVSCLIICVVIVLAYLYAYVDKNSYVYNKNADPSTFYSTGILTEGQEVAQSFVSKEDTIDGFNIKTVILGNVENVVIHYALLDKNSEQVYKGSVPAIELEDNKFNKLGIPQISGVNGQEYTFVLSVEGADEYNGVAFYVEPGRHEGQELVINGNSTDGTLVIRFICHRFDVETFIVLLGMITFVTAFMKVLYKLFK